MKDKYSVYIFVAAEKSAIALALLHVVCRHIVYVYVKDAPDVECGLDCLERSLHDRLSECLLHERFTTDAAERWKLQNLQAVRDVTFRP